MEFISALSGLHDITIDELVKQTDFEKSSVIYKSGCNFMTTIALPQLLTGKILTQNEIQEIWNTGTVNTAISYIKDEQWYWYKVDAENLADGWIYGKYLDIEP